MLHRTANKNLLDYLDGALSGDRRMAVERHVESCSKCRHEIETIKSAKKAAAFLRSKEAPSAAIDADILSAARIAATRQRGNILESEEIKRAPIWKFMFRPATITAMAVVCIIGVAVVYLPQDKIMNEAIKPSQKGFIAPTAPAITTPVLNEKQKMPVGETGHIGTETDSEKKDFALDDIKKKRTASDNNLVVKSGADNSCVRKPEGQAAEAPAGPSEKMKVADNAPQPPKASFGARAPAQAAPKKEAPPPMTEQAADQIAQTPAPGAKNVAAVPPAMPQSAPAPQAQSHAPEGQGAAGPAVSATAGLRNEAASDENRRQLAATGGEQKQQKRMKAQASGQVDSDVRNEEREATTQEVHAKTQQSGQADALMRKARQLEQKNDWAAAAKVYSEIAKKYPNYRHQEVLYRMGKAYAAQKDYARAQQYYDKLKKEAPAQNYLSDEEYKNNKAKVPAKKNK